MGGELHGREPVLAALVPRLTGYSPAARSKARPEHAEDLPVIALTGGRGLGKTVLLRRIAEDYRPHAPVGFLDCESDEFAGPFEDTWSAAAEALLSLGIQLGPRPTGAPREARAIGFLRLLAGLLAVASGGWPSDDERLSEHWQRIALLAAPDPRGRERARTWVTQVLTQLATEFAGVPPPFESVVSTAVDSLLQELFDRQKRAVIKGFGDYPHAGGDAHRGLVLLAQDFRRGGDYRTQAEHHLARALRADLEAAYQGLSGWRRTATRPLVLIDNAHHPLGRALLQPILRDRADGRPDRTVILAALRAHDEVLLPPQVQHCSVAAVRYVTPWARPARQDHDAGDPSHGLLEVRLTPLEPAHVRRMVDAEAPDPDTPPRLARAIHRLTGGQPTGVSLLARAAGQHHEQPRLLTPGTLLATRLPSFEGELGGITRDLLLARLVPAGRLSRLTVLAAAHDTVSAAALASIRLRGDGGTSGVYDLAAELTEQRWPADPEYFVGDVLLRTLLLHRLRHLDAGPVPAVWNAVHTTLIGHYRDDPARRLHHELALGETGNAVARLRETFAAPNTAAWLDELRFIASAPCFAVPDERRAVALGETDADQPHPPGVDLALHLRIRRLLYAAWQLSDPLALPDDEVVEKLRDELRWLSEAHPTGNRTLWQASRSWPAAVLEWRPLPQRST
ncbi:hypothetical protein ACGFRG_01335 [Streptomyces sp. NPDC048696]|uniref:hypothetical protein n=1 Tax=Streptomyces sp. NPDC048696 TaxID=3365585 RepID=UPI003712D649